MNENEEKTTGYVSDNSGINLWTYSQNVRMQYMIDLFDRMSRSKRSMSINDARMIFELDPLPEEPAPPWEQEFDPGEDPEAE